MDSSSSIQYLRRSELDVKKWDDCVSKAANGLIYSYSFYLDQMVPGWEALVLDNYRAVMPLPARKKYGVHYLYQPFLIPQGGVTGEITQSTIQFFLAAIPARFKYWDICLNFGNYIPDEFVYQERRNYVLPLNHPFDFLYGRFNDNIKRNLKKGEQAGYTLQKGLDVEQVIELASIQMKADAKNYKENIRRFRQLYQVLSEKKMADTFGILSPAGELHASAVFFFSHHRAYYILVGNHPAGKKDGASHSLIHHFIREHADKNILLDFEGSDIPGLAKYYSSFGAEDQPYPAIQRNKLPYPLKWLKK
jgi:hypothetical protein